MVMATATESVELGRGDGPALVDPRAPRFGQAITASTLAVAIVLGRPVLVYALAVVMLAAILSGWRVDLYALLWRRVARQFVEPREPEPASPHRFARLMGATGTTLAGVLLLAGAPTAGYAVAGLIALIAGFSSVTGYCIGCRMYRGVSFFRRLDVV